MVKVVEDEEEKADEAGAEQETAAKSKVKRAAKKADSEAEADK